MRAIVVAFVALAAGVAAGCSTVGLVRDSALGASGYSYQAGRASQGFASSVPEVESAVIEAMGDLGMRIIRKSREANSLSYEARALDGRRATIEIESQNSLPIVSARIGWFGDEPLSKALFDRIGIRLGTLPPSAIPMDPPSEPAGPVSHTFYSPGASPLPGIRNQSDLGYRDTPNP